MVVWFIILVVTGVSMNFYRSRRPEDDKLEVPSNMVVLFHPTKGEGDLLLGGLIILVSFSQFTLNFFQTIRQVFS